MDRYVCMKADPLLDTKYSFTDLTGLVKTHRFETFQLRVQHPPCFHRTGIWDVVLIPGVNAEVRGNGVF